MTGHLLSEADFQGRVIATARLHHWRIAHFRPARRQSGSYSTPMTGDRGFPDLVLARNGAVLLAELKADSGRLGPGQPEWLAALGDHGRLWRPADWDAVMAELAGGHAAGCRITIHTPAGQP